MATARFALPKDGPIYSENIFNRCRALISYEVWSGIDMVRMDAWINNFRTPEEQYFGACVLDFLIYRSDRQTVALMRQLFQRIIPDLQRTSSLPFCLRNIYDKLRDASVDPGIRLVPVFSPSDPPTKSALTIARMLKRHLRFSEHWIIRPDEVQRCVSSGAQAVVFIDDFLGTGDQFGDFLTDAALTPCLAGACCIYTPLAGHIEGCNRLHTAFPNLHVAPVEVLTDRHGLFSDTAGVFPDSINSRESARDFYYDLIKQRKIAVSGPDRRGYGHFELVYAFENAVPDNSLPIIWWAKSPDWQPLFDR